MKSLSKWNLGPNWFVALAGVIIGIPAFFMLWFLFMTYIGYSDQKTGAEAAQKIAGFTQLPEDAIKNPFYCLHMGSMRNGPLYLRFDADEQLLIQVVTSMKLTTSKPYTRNRITGPAPSWANEVLSDPSSVTHYTRPYGPDLLFSKSKRIVIIVFLD